VFKLLIVTKYSTTQVPALGIVNVIMSVAKLLEFVPVTVCVAVKYVDPVAMNFSVFTIYQK
jgi:hypothetical protein